MVTENHGFFCCTIVVSTFGPRNTGRYRALVEVEKPAGPVALLIVVMQSIQAYKGWLATYGHTSTWTSENCPRTVQLISHSTTTTTTVQACSQRFNCSPPPALGENATILISFGHTSLSQPHEACSLVACFSHANASRVLFLQKVFVWWYCEVDYFLRPTLSPSVWCRSASVVFILAFKHLRSIHGDESNC